MPIHLHGFKLPSQIVPFQFFLKIDDSKLRENIRHFIENLMKCTDHEYI